MAELNAHNRSHLQKRSLLAGVLVVVLVAGLWLPLLQMTTRIMKESSLNGWVPASDPRPKDLVAAWFDRRLQRWSEAQIGSHIGFRTVLVRTYNQVVFDLFRGLKEVVEVPPGELIYQRHVMSLNDTVLKRDQFLREYTQRAQRAWLVQRVLARNGSHLLMMIVPSKGGSYPDKVPRRFLARDAATLLSTGVHYGDVLAEAGVDVIDFTREFRALRARTTVPLDAPYGVHWNFYAGCLAAQRTIEHLATRYSESLVGVGCDPVVTEESRWTDIDGLNLLNLWWPQDYFRPLPYPTIQAIARPEATRPKVLFIGDSFSDQMRRAFSLARAFKETAFASYFATLERYGIDVPMNQNPAVAIDRASFDFFPDGEPYHFIILESVDYNLSYKEFGFLETVLKRLLPLPPVGLEVDARDRASISPMLMAGWEQPIDGGVQVSAWPATLAFQMPLNPAPRRLTLRVTVTDESEVLEIRSGGEVLPTRRQLLGKERGASANGDTSGQQIVLSSDLPPRPNGADPFAVISITPAGASPGGLSSPRTVILNSFQLE